MSTRTRQATSQRKELQNEIYWRWCIASLPAPHLDFDSIALRMILTFLLSSLAVCLCVIASLLSTHSLTVSAVSAEHREAYFDGSAYLRLNTPMLLWGHSAISFRTCRGEFTIYANCGDFY